MDKPKKVIKGNFPTIEERIAEATVNLRGFLDGSLTYEGTGNPQVDFAPFYLELLEACDGDVDKTTRIVEECVDGDHGEKGELIILEDKKAELGQK